MEHINPTSGITIRELRKKIQSTAPEGGRETYVGRSVRFFSIYFTRVFAKTNIPPNQLTVVSVLIYLFGTSLFFFQDYRISIIAVFLTYLSIIFDACDGETSRLKGNKSGVGATYVEPASHTIQYAYMFLPLSVGLYVATGSVAYIIIGFIGTISKLVSRALQNQFWSVLEYGQSLKAEVKGGGEQPKLAQDIQVSKAHRIYRFINRNFLSSVGHVIPLLFFALINRLDLYLIIFVTYFVLLATIIVVRHVRYISKLTKMQS